MTAAVCLLAGALCAGAGAAFRLLPETWICDYGEAPGPRHAAAQRRMPVWALLLFGLCGAACAFGLAQTAAVQLAGAARFVALSLLCAAVSLLLLAALCDARYTILPDQLLLAAALCSAGAWLLGAWRGVHAVWWSPLAGAAAGFAGLWAVGTVAAKLCGQDAMGFGDVKLLCALGLLCGLGGLGVAVLAAVLTAALAAAVLLLRGRCTRHDALPFGPFLVAGALFAVCLRPQWLAALEWYLSLF